MTAREDAELRYESAYARYIKEETRSVIGGTFR